MHIGFIGAGKVGFSLGRYFVEKGMSIEGYFSRSPESCKEAADFTGSRAFGSMDELLERCDTVFITVPDGSIRSVYEQLTGIGISGVQLCHCSGSLSAAEAFPDIEKHGGYGCSIHPLFPVSSRYESYKELGSAFFCMEGSAEHISIWSSIFTGFGNSVRIISGEHKSRYHAACAIASNLVCALAACSTELLKKCGFTEEEALSALRPLAVSNIGHIFSSGPAGALTGPVERNDAATVMKHIECLDNAADRDMYRAVSMKLVELALEKHPDRDYSALRSCLEGSGKNIKDEV